jgi:hypothetical protein
LSYSSAYALTKTKLIIRAAFVLFIDSLVLSPSFAMALLVRLLVIVRMLLRRFRW